MAETPRPAPPADPPSDDDFERAYGHVQGGEEPPLRSRAFLAACVAAVGVVYGSIGTSPLYTWSEIRLHGALASGADVLGACSLVLWTLVVVASAKYVGLLLSADNQGEGGTFALLAQVERIPRPAAATVAVLLVFATALLYGEGLVAPAITVLSAVEGLRVADPHLGPLVVPITLALLTALFAFQYQRQGRAERWAFGPVMVAWFVVIGALGALQIVRRPDVLLALSPHHAIGWLWRYGGWTGIGVLGSVALCVTGAEVIYADMGRAGARSLRAAWWALVFPALLLQYLGQGALLLSGDPIVADNVFYSMVPAPLVLPVVGLAVAAALVTTQALITLGFSVTRSAINLGLLPRVAVVHLHRAGQGRIYLPIVNFWLWLGCCVLVAAFGSSTELAAAYGLAVTGTMVATSVAFALVAEHRFGWTPRRAQVVAGTFLAFEGTYLLANVVKIPAGAWVTLVVATVLFVTMQVWRSGRQAASEAYGRVERATVRQLVALKPKLPELPRAMVYLTGERVLSFDDPLPLVLLKFVDRYGALPRHVTMFSIVLEQGVPYWHARRFDVRQFGENVTSVRMHVGYMESPNARAALVHLKRQRQVKIHATRWTIVMGREEIFLQPGGGPLWRLPYLLFGMLAGLAGQAHLWFGIGTDTGISKEVIPLVVGRDGTMTVIVRRPELEPAPPRDPDQRVPTEEIPTVVTEDAALPPGTRS